MKKPTNTKIVLCVILLSVTTFGYLINVHLSKKNVGSPYEKYDQLTVSEIEKIPKYDRPDLAVMQNYEMTKDPSGLVPVKRTLEAFQDIKQKAKSSKGLENVSWEERGPDNVGGRTRALMYDPNDASNKKVWAGGVAGGLWYSDDIQSASSKWNNVDDFWANLAITAITYDPNNTQTFYVGTGEGFYNSDAIEGSGIWKSTDGGNTWANIYTNFSYTQDLVVTTDGNIFAATRYGLYQSIDGGVSWARDLTGRIADLEISKNGDIYASRGIFSTQAIFKSTDGGDNWTEITPDSSSGYGRIELATAPTDNDVVYAIGAGSDYYVSWFKKSEDGGETWTDLTIPTYHYSSCSADNSQDFTRGQAWYDLILKVDPLDEDHVIVGGVDLHKSTDGGQTWGIISNWRESSSCAEYVHADQHAIEFNPSNSGEAIFGNDGGIFYSDNAGFASIATPNFEARNNGYNITQFYAGDQENLAGSNLMIAGAQDNGSHMYSSTGINSTTEVTGGDGAFCHIDQFNSDIMITSYVYNSYWLSTNKGSSFSRVINDLSTGRFINPTDYDDNAKALYATSEFDMLFRITDIDGSPTTETLDLDLDGYQISTIKVDPYSNNTVWLGTPSYNIYKVTNATSSNPTVTAINIGSVYNVYASSIDIGSSSDQILVTFSNYGTTSVWETRDGGTTWESKEGNLPDIPVRGGLYNPNNTNEVLLATELGVWSCDDFDSSSPVWEVTNTGLANVRCDMLQYRQSDGQVMVSTHGRGVYTGFPFQTVDDDESPTTPDNLFTSNITDSSFELNWSASTDNIGVKSYNIYLDGNLEASTTITSYTGSGLDASTSYVVEVEAQDYANNVSSKGTITIVTLDQSTCPAITFDAIDAYTSEDKVGDFEIQDSGNTLFLENNTWKSISYDYDVTSNTVLEFDFKSTSQGEMHAIGFDNNESTSSDYTFMLWGTQTWAIEDFKNYNGDGSYEHYTIPVGDYYQGSFDKIFFANDFDAGSGNNSYFKNLVVHEGDCQDTNVSPTAPENLTASNITTSSFDLTWSASSDDDGIQQYNIYLDGSLLGNTSSTTYSVTGLNTSNTYTVGVEALDNLGSVSTISEINVSTIDNVDICSAITMSNIDSYSSEDKSGDFQIQDNGITLYLENNTWKSFAYDYTVTSNTVLEFDFKSTDEGEMHGIGFDDDNLTSSDLTFMVWGTQTWAIQDFNNYSGSGSYVHYVIPVGDYYQGTFDKISFSNDFDAGSGNTSYFTNIVVHEGDCEGVAIAQLQPSSIGEIGVQLTDDLIFDIYPNPVVNYLNVDLQLEVGNYQIISVSGNIIESGVINGSHLEIDLVSLTRGIYVLKIDGEGFSSHKKFMKQ